MKTKITAKHRLQVSPLSKMKPTGAHDHKQKKLSENPTYEPTEEPRLEDDSESRHGWDATVLTTTHRTKSTTSKI
jgi:hypothetical protein